jgi:hypothetical protein
VTLSGKIETTANVATIIVAALISAALIKPYLSRSSTVRTATVTSVPGVIPGKSISGQLPGVSWTNNHRTLVLALSTTCHFCKDSIPFYRKLNTVPTDVKMVAVLPQPVAEARKYLVTAGVRVDDVKQVSLGTLGVRGTPTLLLVNDRGTVTDVWTGKLQSDQETQVVTALGKKTSGG